jgi:hypothetical protein
VEKLPASCTAEVDAARDDGAVLLKTSQKRKRFDSYRVGKFIC